MIFFLKILLCILHIILVVISPNEEVSIEALCARETLTTSSTCGSQGENRQPQMAVMKVLCWCFNTTHPKLIRAILLLATLTPGYQWRDGARRYTLVCYTHQHVTLPYVTLRQEGCVRSHWWRILKTSEEKNTGTNLMTPKEVWELSAQLPIVWFYPQMDSRCFKLKSLFGFQQL